MREGQLPFNLCRLWAPPKSEKVECWAEIHGFQILSQRRIFSFGFLAEIEFWDMGDEFELWFSSYDFWVMRYSQSKHRLNIPKSYYVHIGSIRSTLVHFVLFNPLWLYSVHFGPIRSTLVLSTLVLFGQHWSYSVHYVHFGPNLSIHSYLVHSVHFDPIQSTLILFGHI